MTEDMLEDAYSQYLHRQGQRDAAARRRARLQVKRKPGDPNPAPEEEASESDHGSGSDGERRPRFAEPDAPSEVTHVPHGSPANVLSIVGASPSRGRPTAGPTAPRQQERCTCATNQGHCSRHQL